MIACFDVTKKRDRIQMLRTQTRLVRVLFISRLPNILYITMLGIQLIKYIYLRSLCECFSVELCHYCAPRTHIQQYQLAPVRTSVNITLSL